MTERLGVLGGTFDPVHIGHLAAAVNARHALRLDRVLLVVAHHPWQKSGRPITPAADRLAMVEAAVADRNGLEASRIEIDRGGDTYTADTLEQLHHEDPQTHLFLIVGTDVAAELHTWKRPDIVARLATLAVVGRGGVDVHDAAALGPEWRVERVDMPPLDISSSELRQRLGDGRPVDFLVPDPVINLIRQRGLYAGDTMTTGSGGR
ncbi:MAG: nicotinate-nucleotide adenylyltransferase [Actinomycetota bacterium]|jgi:nicotinate-nucleotide adenylyltransferase|nr:nicotinate-nucleotide adenylyltransferase [Actinomycetota bacterium]